MEFRSKPLGPNWIFENDLAYIGFFADKDTIVKVNLRLKP